MIKNDIFNLIKKALEDENVSTEKLSVELSDHADFSTSIALKLGKLGNYQNPIEIANYLVAKMEKSELVKKAEVAGSGFINFEINPEYATKKLRRIVEQGSGFGDNQVGKGLKTQVEFISANPTGPLTLGNGRGAFTGDTLSKVLKMSGFDIEREYYLNDRGNQVEILGKSILNQVLLEKGEKGLSGTEFYKGDYIKDLAKDFSQVTNPKEALATITSDALKKLIFQTKSLVTEKLKVDFDVWFSENSMYQDNLQIEVLKLLGEKKLTFEKEGSIWFKSTKFSDDKDRVLVKADGEYTYFLSDIIHKGYLAAPKFDRLVLLLGADHHGYQARLQAAMEALDQKGKLSIIIFQLVRLIEKGKEVRMSKRAGTYVTLEELIDEVGLDATRFFFNMYSPNTHIDFNLDLAKEKSNKNPVYYVQYAHARLCSILAKAPKVEIEADLSLLIQPEELVLTKKLLQFDDLVADIAKNYSVHQLTFYAIAVAEAFHSFYEKHKVISDDKDLTAARIELIASAKITLCNTLNLLGVSAPEKM